MLLEEGNSGSTRSKITGDRRVFSLSVAESSGKRDDEGGIGPYQVLVLRRSALKRR